MQNNKEDQSIIRFSEGSGFRDIDLSNGLQGELDDLVRVRIQGETPCPIEFHENISDSIVTNAQLREANLERCDIKDTLVKSSQFSYCRFDGGSFATSFFENSSFFVCTFANVGITETQFFNCTFRDCDLSHLLAKGCRLIGCQFERCKTSNKVFESSLLLDCRFTNTDLQIQTICDNFGLTSQSLFQSMIRSGRAQSIHHTLTADEIIGEAESFGRTFIEKLRVHYFIKGELLSGSEHLDAILSAASWTAVARVPTTFSRLLSDATEFMLFLYERSLLTAHTILKLHSALDVMRREFERQPEHLLVYQAVTGVYVTVARIVEQYLLAVSSVTNSLTNESRLIADGPIDIAYFSKLLAPFLEGTGAEVEDVVPHNSPARIKFRKFAGRAILNLVALFLATRTHFEITHSCASIGADKPSESATEEASPGNALFAVSFGFMPDSPTIYGIKLRSLLPGSLLVDLRLLISTEEIGAMRKVLVGWVK